MCIVKEQRRVKEKKKLFLIINGIEEEEEREGREREREREKTYQRKILFTV